MVVDEGKSPIIGATIQVKGANNGTITDIDGNFSLEVKNPKAQLQISYIGFTTITVPVQLKGKMTITMQEHHAIWTRWWSSAMELFVNPTFPVR